MMQYISLSRANRRNRLHQTYHYHYYYYYYYDILGMTFANETRSYCTSILLLRLASSAPVKGMSGDSFLAMS